MTKDETSGGAFVGETPIPLFGSGITTPADCAPSEEENKPGRMTAKLIGGWEHWVFYFCLDNQR